jgi:DNA-binding transcriptional LysR family regulator
MLHLILRELEIFVAITDFDSVTVAAENLGLTQSAASQSLAKLENTLNTLLFDRISKRLILNENGRRLLPQAKLLLEQAQELQQSFVKIDTYELRIGASTTIANYILPSCLAQFQQQYPLSKTNLIAGNTQEIAQAVANLEVDFGFIEGPYQHPDLNVQTWKDDELVVFTRYKNLKKSDVLTKHQLASASWVTRESGSGTRDEIERLLVPLLPKLNIVMEFNHPEAIKNAVAAGLGVSCLSKHVIEKELQAKQLMVVETSLPKLKRNFYKIQHREKKMTIGMDIFLKFINLTK